MLIKIGVHRNGASLLVKVVIKTGSLFRERHHDTLPSPAEHNRLPEHIRLIAMRPADHRPVVVLEFES